MNTIKFNKQNVKMVAHRGLSGIETMNTCASFLAATIIKEAGGDYTNYGVPFDEVKNDGTVERTFFKTNLGINWKDISVEKYTVKGSSRVPENWTKVDSYDVKYNFYG